MSRFQSFESPFSRPQKMDSNGVAWESRSDNRIKQELLKAGVSDEDYLDADQLLQERNWYGLREHLAKVADYLDTDERLRVEKCMTIANEVIENERSGF